jgi:hypothetical protein
VPHLNNDNNDKDKDITSNSTSNYADDATTSGNLHTDPWTKFTCMVCVDRKTNQPKVLHGVREWEIHLKSTGHWRRLEGLKKREKWEKEKAERMKRNDEAGGIFEEDGSRGSGDEGRRGGM